MSLLLWLLLLWLLLSVPMSLVFYASCVAAGRADD